LFLPAPLAEIEGLTVLFDDKPAALLAVTPGQINLQVPVGVAAGMVTLRVVRNGAEVLSSVAQIAATSPGLFLADTTRGDQPGAILNQDSRPNSSSIRARRGEIIQIFATGAGQTSMPRAYVAAESAEVVYSGMSTEFRPVADQCAVA
jgi:uncharacterized protein (TIGR03437 family)